MIDESDREQFLEECQAAGINPFQCQVNLDMLFLTSGIFVILVLGITLLVSVSILSPVFRFIERRDKSNSVSILSPVFRFIERRGKSNEESK
ncbi:hypothetical protein [Spirulina sp. 06S082]|uniref:hypothetical protein n=1 Tax=Spirulina sp. 06S082 TaxID=3110248 RepID=UPI002B21ECEE|nr:hypothetical protein [Spirulina sp. 06S082]MEA5472149.1 hypothetical protein [Spirulina sp. 06S082]